METVAATSSIDWQAWVQSRSPTTQLPASYPANDGQIREGDLPLRVVPCRALAYQQEVAMCRPTNWEFASISYRWGNNPGWSAFSMEGKQSGPHQVTAVQHDSLVGLAKLCLSLGIEHFWIDCLCIDQSSPAEKASEILRMGKYYSHAAKILVFPWGLDDIGPPTRWGADPPSYQSRAWTLQEEILSGQRAFAVIFITDCVRCQGICNLQCRGLCRGEASTIALQPTSEDGLFASMSSAMRVEEDSSTRQAIHLVPMRHFSTCQNMYLDYHHSWVNNDVAANTHALVAHNLPFWLTNVMTSFHQMFRRQAHLEEDMVYSMFGLLETLNVLRLDLDRQRIRYNIGVRLATLTMADYMRADMLPLLTILEAYHGHVEAPLDGFGSLPAYRDPTSRTPPVFLCKQIIATGHTVKGSTGDLTGLELNGLAVELHYQKSIHHDNIEANDNHEMNIQQAGFEMLVCTDAHSARDASEPIPRQAGVLAVINGKLDISTTYLLIAVSVSPVMLAYQRWYNAYATRKQPESRSDVTTFCCLICVKEDKRYRKLGLAIVRPEDYDWSQRDVLIG